MVSQGKKEKLLEELIEERTQLIAELFSKPKKERLIEIEKRIAELDQIYLSLQE